MKCQSPKYYRLLILFACALFIDFTGQVALAQYNYRWGNQDRQQVELIVGGDFVVTMNDAQPVIKNSAVALKEGKIVAVDTLDKIQASYKTSKTLPGEGRVLMPGLVNGHSHTAMVLFRGLADDLSLLDINTIDNLSYV